MKAVLSRLSKFGFQVDGGEKDKWVNVSKYDSVSLDGLNKGDSVEYEVNKKGYVTKIVKLSSASSATKTESSSDVSDATESSGRTAHVSDVVTDKDLRITRLSALSTAFGAPYTRFSSVEGLDLDEAAKKSEELALRLTRYALTGKFDESVNADVKALVEAK